MYCKKCGNEIKEDANFCPKCGAPINKSYQNLKNGWLISPAPKPPNKKNNKVVIGSIFVAAAAVVAVIGFIFVKSGITRGNNNTISNNIYVSVPESKTVTTLLRGTVFNDLIHYMAGDDMVEQDVLNNIEGIQFINGENLSNYDLSSATIVSTEDSSLPAYAFYDSGTKLITVITEADTFCANSDSAQMFFLCKSLTTLDFCSFDTGNVTNMMDMFYGCESLTTLNLSGFDTNNVTDMSWMFNECGNLTSLDLSGFDTSNVTDMSGMFSDCRNLTALDISGFDTSNVTDMSWMFGICESLNALDFSNFDTSNVTNMHSMLCGCCNLITLDLSSFDTSNVTDMSWMVNGCESLNALNLSNFDTSNVTNMWDMFEFCESLTSLDLSSFNTKNVTDMSGMFNHCDNLQIIYASDLFVVDSVIEDNEMFYKSSNLVGGAGTNYSESLDGIAYAHIDEGVTNPGYFTRK